MHHFCIFVIYQIQIGYTQKRARRKNTHTTDGKKRRQMREITMWWLSWFWRRVTQVMNSVEVSALIYYMKQYLLFSLLHLQTLGSLVLDVSLSVYYLLLSISITNFMNNLNRPHHWAALDPVPSPWGALVRLSPQTKLPVPQTEIWNIISQWSFCQF